ncbi:MAG: hypothetical protein KJ626_07015 [Verrucomicrobia bacterium]|nr:hypothetical protein [Verrucomicrobiota bacterium]
MKRKFFILFCSLLGLLILRPFLDPVSIVGQPIQDLLLVLVILTSVAAVTNRHGLKWVSVGAALAAFFWRLLATWAGLPWMAGGTYVLHLFFFGLTATIILGHVLGHGRVTTDMIFGSLSVYLLLGLIWALLFFLIEKFYPGSFAATAGQNISKGLIYVHPTRVPDLVYFSYASLTTIGYGDIYPVAPVARTLAVLEGVNP